MRRREVFGIIGACLTFGSLSGSASVDKDDDDNRAWTRFAMEQFFRGYAEEDSIYDDLV